MKSAYIGIASFGLVCALFCALAFGGSVGKPVTAPGSECVFLNNLSLFANACAVYSPHPIPPPHGSPPDHAGPPDDTGAPDHAGGPEAADCIVCHGAADLVSANLAYFASADAVYNPHPGPHPHDAAPLAVSCTVCHGMGKDITITALELGTGTGSGGGMYNADSSSPVLMNCTFSANEASTGGGMYNDASSSATVTNCIFWGDILSDDTPSEIEGNTATVTYSCVQGGYTGEGNIADDPSFVDAANDDLRLNLDSPCIDSGTVNSAPSADILGMFRPLGACFDMGAYEYIFSLIITQQPVSQNVLEGQSLTFSVSVSGETGPISYQWRRDGMNLFPGGDQSAYLIASAAMDLDGSYTCLVADEFNGEKLRSAIATLAVFSGMPVAGGLALATAVLAVGLLGVLRLRRRTK